MDDRGDPVGGGGGMSWIIEPAGGFPHRAGQWQALNAQSLASPLLDADFAATLLAHFGDGSELLARYERGGDVLAMALLARRAGGAWETFQPSQAPIGMWLQRRELSSAVLMAELIRALPGLALVLSVLQRDPVLEPRPVDGGPVSTMDYIETARVTVAGSFAHYWNGRGKNLRSNLKKQRARLEREGITTRLEIVQAPEAAAAAIADYARLEQSGWKAAQGTAVRTDSAQGNFYAALFARFCARGEGRIYRYWFGDQLVAMDLCLVADGTVFILKTAYDATAPHGLSPTLLMRQEQFGALFDEGDTRAIEFYGRVMEWHLRWTDEVRTMYHVTAFRWALLGAIKSLLRSGFRRRQRAAPELSSTLKNNDYVS